MRYNGPLETWEGCAIQDRLVALQKHALRCRVACFEQRLLGQVFGREEWISSPEDVVLSKLLWYRAPPSLGRQFQHVIEVYEIQESHPEQGYLERWARLGRR